MIWIVVLLCFKVMVIEFKLFCLNWKVIVDFWIWLNLLLFFLDGEKYLE